MQLVIEANQTNAKRILAEFNQSPRTPSVIVIYPEEPSADLTQACSSRAPFQQPAQAQSQAAVRSVSGAVLHTARSQEHRGDPCPFGAKTLMKATVQST